jgi:acetyl-CoA carboxylase biotin carboxyl carrier protein
MKMDLNYLKKLIKILDSSDLAELEIEEEGSRIKLTKPQANAVHTYTPVSMPAQAVHSMPVSGGGAGANESATAEAEKPVEKKEAPSVSSENLFEVRSPMVGTFYRAPSPDADPYVKPGEIVNPGSVLCIIEAMKLMNEIECEVSGKVVKVLAENAQAVEYNQPLFLIEKS